MTTLFAGSQSHMCQWHPSLLLVFPVQSKSYTPNTDMTDFQLPRLLIGERSNQLRGSTPLLGRPLMLAHLLCRREQIPQGYPVESCQCLT
ncbi:hypothetical protein ASPFODRAFT_461128 [Aspergillus luchuensis CBS 106.47]|uniref:Uncharacterized protein n=1 Tax=Aspergillus luchuensis (strain CBS 106.47) TaxID=1137211 RepID=A0A1M3T0T9_ASPLC|nr:hypothetical protein ASPFODRAFT_461128 [Aspergillus luchuensis CBS 106.47]